MKIIFLGTTGVHQALVAANIYLEMIPDDKLQTIKGFSDASRDASGFPIFVGNDDKGDRVYALGVGRNVQLGVKTIGDLVRIFGHSPDDLLVKHIRIRGELILWLLCRIAQITGEKILCTYLSEYIVKWQFNTICKGVEEFKLSLSSN